MNIVHWIAKKNFEVRQRMNESRPIFEFVHTSEIMMRAIKLTLLPKIKSSKN